MKTARTQLRISKRTFAILREGAVDREPVSGLTHCFYRYPARFSPRFAAAAIRCFSKPGDLVLDPYMGGGTTIVEGMALGRHMVGNDLNSLAVFVTKVKTTPLSRAEMGAIREWSEITVPTFSYHESARKIGRFIDDSKVRNLTLVRARFIKKCIGVALASIAKLPTPHSQDFAKCVVLRVGQWALDNRSRHTSLKEFRARIQSDTADMLRSLSLLAQAIHKSDSRVCLVNCDAAEIATNPLFSENKKKADLVVTSPPYPGVHVLYHRWQVDGRRETPAPYWISGCEDGQGVSFYNFGDRRQSAADQYFESSLRTLKAIRKVMRKGGLMVQMVAFNRPKEQLPRYLENMRDAGFSEKSAGHWSPSGDQGRIWREVPNRKWHATTQGRTHSSNEVVLVHGTI